MQQKGVCTSDKKVVDRLPFHNDKGEIEFPIRALGGVIFILPDRKYKEEDLKGLYLPEGIKSRKNSGIALSCGPGCVNKRTKKFEHGVKAGTRVFFEDSVPWGYEAVDKLTGKTHKLVMCSILDVVAIEE